MSGERDPERPIAAVQNAAVEHALTARESRDALALVGALEPLRARPPGPDGERSPLGDSHDCGSASELSPRSQSHTPLSVPSMVLSTVLSALTGLQVRSKRDHRTAVPSPAATEPHLPRDGVDASAPPAVVGAVVACERFDLSPAYAASLADCEVSAVRQVLAERGGAGGSANDPPSGQ